MYRPPISPRGTRPGPAGGNAPASPSRLEEHGEDFRAGTEPSDEEEIGIQRAGVHLHERVGANKGKAVSGGTALAETGLVFKRTKMEAS